MTDTIEETVTRTPDLLDLLTLAGRPAEAPPGLVLGWRNTHPDLISRGDFQWSFPGNWTESPDDGRDLSTAYPISACPSGTLGGLCVAKTWHGAQSGGITSAACLVLAYSEDDILGQDAHKVRVRRALTICVVDTARLIRSADLRSANLRFANLRSANLRSANLRSANLRSADLSSADLRSANLRSANLSSADLSSANLSLANLRLADLTYAPRGDKYTQLPAGYVVNDAGLIVRTS